MIRRPLALGLPYALLLLLAACGKKTEAPVFEAPLVLAHRVGTDPEGALALRGAVSARSRMRLGFRQPGILATVAVRAGDGVRAGQLLATLDDADARAQVLAATAQRDKARRDSERATRLAAEGAVSTSLRDDALNQLQAAEAHWAIAQEALHRTRLVAAAPGTVFQRLAEPGESIGAGNPILLVDETSRLVLKVGVTDRDLKRVREGQPVTVTPEDGSAGFPGRVNSVGATPNPEDGLFAIEVTPASPRKLTAGVLMQVRFEGAQRPAIRIPLEALVHRQDRDFVFVLEGAPQAKVRLRPVEVGKSEGTTLQVRSGLQGGERIVAEGAYFLQDGQTVRVKE